MLAGYWLGFNTSLALVTKVKVAPTLALVTLHIVTLLEVAFIEMFGALPNI